MLYIIIVGFILLILAIAIFIFFFNYIKLKDIKVSIDTCSVNIEKTLETKFDMINQLLEEIDDEKIKKDFSYNENESLYEREDNLFNISFVINKYVKDKKTNIKTKTKTKSKIQIDSSILNKVKELNSLEENLDGLKDFYNTNVLNYNEIFLKRPINKLFKLLKFNSYKSFKIRKLEEYEIFKI